MESTQVGMTFLTSRNNIPHPILYLSLLLLGQLFSQMHTHGECPSVPERQKHQTRKTRYDMMFIKSRLWPISCIFICLTHWCHQVELAL